MALIGGGQSAGVWCTGEGDGRGLWRWDLGQRERTVTKMSYTRGIDEWQLNATASSRQAVMAAHHGGGEVTKRGEGEASAIGAFRTRGERGGVGSKPTHQCWEPTSRRSSGHSGERSGTRKSLVPGSLIGGATVSLNHPGPLYLMGRAQSV
jgi:hypothetical protein